MGTNINSNGDVFLFQILQVFQNNDIMIDLIDAEDNYLIASFSSKTLMDVFEESALVGVINNIKINNKKHITLYIDFNEEAIENYDQKASLSAILSILNKNNKDMMVDIIGKESNVSVINFDITAYIQSLNSNLLGMPVDKIKINSDNSIQIIVIEEGTK